MFYAPSFQVRNYSMTSYISTYVIYVYIYVCEVAHLAVRTFLYMCICACVYTLCGHQVATPSSCISLSLYMYVYVCVRIYIYICKQRKMLYMCPMHIHFVCILLYTLMRYKVSRERPQVSGSTTILDVGVPNPLWAWFAGPDSIIAR